MREILRVLALWVAVAWPSVATDSPSLLIAQGRWAVGGLGSLALSLNQRIRTSLDLELSPKESYLVMKGLELGISARMAGPIASSDSEGFGKLIEWGFGGSVRYYFDIERSFYPFVGILGDFGMTNNWVGTFIYTFGLESGLLFGITKSVAFEVTMPIKATFAGTYF